MRVTRAVLGIRTPQRSRTTRREAGARPVRSSPNSGAGTREAPPQDSGRLEAGQPTDRGAGGRPHGSDKGREGGGEGGGVPPAQKPEYP
ncbi:hypothetical protein SAMN05216532_1207 [Streptomyces sp. 2231.1]|nr:hypothetical protein SAMN05216532_1207 [Streptomyces sp. 2231.1]